jgi:phage terminase small subunit
MQDRVFVSSHGRRCVSVAKKQKLTPKQARFVREYLVDLNASAAARRAGYSEKRA